MLLAAVLGILLQKLRVLTCLLASAPGGLTDITLIAMGMEVERANLAVLQIGRFISMVVFFPHIFRFVLYLLA